MEIVIDMHEVKGYESDLKEFASRAFPFATKKTLNDAAFDAQKGIQRGIRREMITRNKYTVNSIRVEPCKTLYVRGQEAVVGSIAPYMDMQEFGGVKHKRGKIGTPLPTTVASGEGRGAARRYKTPRGINKLSKIRLAKRGRAKYKSKKQEIYVAVLMAAREGRKVVYLDTGSKQGIYRIKGKGKVDRHGKLTGVRMDMLYDLSHDAVTIPRTPTFAPATRNAQARMPMYYRNALIFQLKRQGLFKG